MCTALSVYLYVLGFALVYASEERFIASLLWPVLTPWNIFMGLYNAAQEMVVENSPSPRPPSREELKRQRSMGH
jgi:hypothetical protein